MDDFQRTLIAADYSADSIGESWMNEEVSKGRHHYLEYGSWSTEADIAEIVPVLDWVKISRGSHDGALVGAHGDTILCLTLSGGRLHWKLALRHHDEKVIKDWKEVLLDNFPETQPPDENTIPFRFWMKSSRGHQSYNRMLSVPSWDEIGGNYSKDTIAELESMFTGFQPTHGGQLILWHGVPGTGKTYAIRALAKQWSDWCKFECVVDPEVFFGNAEYMTGVILEGGDEDGLEVIRSLRGAPSERKEQFRVLVLEDAGELLAEDARERTGQGLSRLLNVVDGLIGQGLRLLILITTNEELGKMHSAVARPGRCAAATEFKTFTSQEAQRWLLDHGVTDPEDRGNATLAELYGRVEDFKGAKPVKRPIGLGV